METLFDRLFPIMRSLTGEGVRRSHAILGEVIPLVTEEIPSGSDVLDWTVPPEWIFREAYVTAPDGRRILDAGENTLRVVNYSRPFRGRLTRAELDGHLHSLPHMPDAIPYVTSYYEDQWGFCLTEREREALPDGDYEVVVDTKLDDKGSMTLSHALLPGDEAGEFLISVNTCHPSLANNELSGPLVAAFLYNRIAAWPRRRYSYRFQFMPETIGAISFLANHGERLRGNLAAGYVLTCVGDNGPFHYKRSRRGDSLADRAAEAVLGRDGGPDADIYDFTPWGSDERQYCSPGFDLPVGAFMRAVPGQYAAYHTSLDDKIDFDAMMETVSVIEAMCRAIDGNRAYRNLKPYGEPKLDRYGLYPTTGAQISQPEWLYALRWLLNLSDGQHDLLKICERCRLPFDLLHDVAERCVEAGLLEPVP